ncbi:hypothetical protein PHLCEN_2v13235 [Hermanssonia centrifuga]|uniref:Uncharacterized protein n=1 Tax=Hermanssonia centrifuga TaxID=98765 RepID=A0A2R6NET7_9APHY|nr:hypothetical protein PHLCEN_2v13235 [Hermanssonia centrifuga]
MDSGMILDARDEVPFEPLLLLLPEELCWMLDRNFACEMEWHSGNTLSQTVFTFLYIHQLADINPDLIPPGFPLLKDPKRPIELVTLVLRAAVFGLLKSCDFVWRELSKKRVFDMEDWQSDKCEVTLLEGVPVDIVLRKLDDACSWLRNSALPQTDKEALCDRLMLRKTLLELFKLSHLDNLDELRPLVAIAKNILRRVQARPSVQPIDGSPALYSFDPRVVRRLHTVMPIRVLELPSQETVWSKVEQLLEGWEQVGHLRSVHSLSGWEIAGSLSVWMSERKLQLPYCRSLTQGTFSDRNLVFGEYPTEWLVDHFFEESLGVSYETIRDVLEDDIERWALKEIEDHIIRVTTNYIKSFWYNPPRHRRFLMRAILDWQLLQDALSNFSSQVLVIDFESYMISFCLPRAAALWKYTAAREILLSGFHQELYSVHERPLAYWYTAHIIEQHIDCIDGMRRVIPSDSVAFIEMQFQSQFLGALQLVCAAMCMITSNALTQPRKRTALNFRRRYKWLFRPESNSELLFPVPLFSDLPEYLDMVTDDEPNENLKLAIDILQDLKQFDCRGVWATEEAKERLAEKQAMPKGALGYHSR